MMPMDASIPASRLSIRAGPVNASTIAWCSMPASMKRSPSGWKPCRA
jgi:hypothetical protein